MLLRFDRIPVVDPPFERILEVERDPGDLLRALVGRMLPARACECPAVDLAEYDNQSVLVAELPGVKKEDVKVSVHDGVLTISGERKSDALPEGSTWVRNEIPAGSFCRAFQLPHDVKTDEISADMSNGVLRVILPKAEEARPREIRIR